MSKTYEFLKECGIFYLLTLNGDYPAGRPFGVVMEVGEDLYISTNDFNQAHKQLRANGHVQIIAKNPTPESGFGLRALQQNVTMQH